MKLLIDQNILPRLLAQMADDYPDSAHVMTNVLDHALDETVWAFSREQGYTLVTKDSDFHELSFVQRITTQSRMDTAVELHHPSDRGDLAQARI